MWEDMDQSYRSQADNLIRLTERPEVLSESSTSNLGWSMGLNGILGATVRGNKASIRTMRSNLP